MLWAVPSCCCSTAETMNSTIWNIEMFYKISKLVTTEPPLKLYLGTIFQYQWKTAEKSFTGCTWWKLPFEAWLLKSEWAVQCLQDSKHFFSYTPLASTAQFAFIASSCLLWSDLSNSANVSYSISNLKLRKATSEWNTAVPRTHKIVSSCIHPCVNPGLSEQKKSFMKGLTTKCKIMGK